MTSAHKYFFGLTEISVNPKNQTIEIIHQFTAHDLENAIAEQKQEHFSPEHPKYDLYIKEYFDNHFQLDFHQKKIELNWVGLELMKGKVIIYQEAQFKNKLAGLVVKNDLLVDTYTKQVNIVNYQDSGLKGSFTFTESNNVAIIEKH
ncbi:DUF6702 family protein [Thalassotalea castellviae]|uniref:Uncharacterized protein n=2 Tax=Thalassotalea TaxID=1518149 RepID=A0ABU3A456_9GAMM|nr:DUF6702 family protein [Thalassotalea sp. W431]MDT0604959.1 hypothetical protein [Thalassotalea sp. W431]